VKQISRAANIHLKLSRLTAVFHFRAPESENPKKIVVMWKLILGYKKVKLSSS